MSASKVALITGCNGQDGSLLSKQLISQGYVVYGTTRVPAHGQVHVWKPHAIKLIELDLNSGDQVNDCVANVMPDELYHLAARSSSSQLFDDPVATAEINAVSTVRILEAIRKWSPNTRFCQASSSEVFAGAVESPQSENTPLIPVNAYGAAKAFAMNIVSAYRLQYGLFACNAILYNHESPLRAPEYVTRKITMAVSRIALGSDKELVLGDLDNRRDWGFAGDYVRAMWMMLQHNRPDDYIVATGKTHSVREFCDVAFSHVGLDYRDYVRIDTSFARRPETVELRGNPERAHRQLGWKPEVQFKQLVEMMVNADIALLKRNAERRP